MIKSKKKILITVLIVIAVVAVIAVAVQFVIRPMVVDYAFSKITDTVIETMGDNAQQNEISESEEPEPSEEDGQQQEQTEQQSEQKAAEERRKKVDSMSVNQVASIVAADAGLMAQLERIVSAADKEKVLAILLSNFSKEEIAKYSAEVAAGITSQRKSELAAMARGRLTSAQWAQCMQLFSKYVDQLRPIIAEKIKN